MLTASLGSKHRAGKEIYPLQIIVNKEGDEIHISQALEGGLILLNNHLYKPHLNKTDIYSGRRDAWWLNNKKRIYFCRLRNPGRSIISIVRLLKLPLTKNIMCSDSRYYQNMSLLWNLILKDLNQQLKLASHLRGA